MGMYYTKYRPQTFAEIQRPNEIADVLLQQVKTGKTVHAYLFTGPRGVGKTTVARLLAKALNCTQLTKEGDICGTCEFCLGVQNGSLLDLVEIDAASNRGIDDIRDLRDKVKLMPAQGKKKIYIIDEVHMLTNEAFNALLKTLEEPPKHAVFILCTTEFHKVPETIKSRCQVFKFKRPAKAQIVEKLKRIAQSESVLEEVTQEEFERVATLAGGAFRDAETILQQLIEGGRIGSKVGLATNYADFLTGLWAGASKKSLEILTTAFDDGVDLAVWTDGLLRYLRDILYLKMGFSDDFFGLSDTDLGDRKHIAQAISKDWVVKTIEIFNQAQNDLKTYSISQLALELAVAKLAPSADLRDVASPREPDPVLPQTTQKPKIEKNPNERTGEAEKDSTAATSQSSVSIDIIENRWKEVITKINKLNNSVGALVKSGKPIQIAGSEVLLEVSYKFHKERLESSTNKRMVEQVLEEVFGDKLGLRCMVCQRSEVRKEGETGELTDLNIRVPQDMVITGKTVVTEVFDGGLPL